MEFKEFFTWMLVVLGWFVIHAATINREVRKENREATTKFVEELRKVEDLAVSFQTSETFSENDYHVLIWKIQRITSALHRPPFRFLKISTGVIIDFRRGLTANTDKSSFLTCSYSDDIIINIHDVSDRLVLEIEIQRYIYFG